MDEPQAVPRLYCPPPAATTPSKVLQSLIHLPGLWGWGDGGGGGTLCPQSNQSLSKHTKVLLLLQLETWLNGEEATLLDRSQLHFILIRKFSRASLSAQTENKYITSFFKRPVSFASAADWMEVGRRRQFEFPLLKQVVLRIGSDPACYIASSTLISSSPRSTSIINSRVFGSRRSRRRRRLSSRAQKHHGS
ncbi:unnamed protein product [Pleuronectes platessa]|uniref:Uncharacterized protein n=1 Tax=Pleuronectes platessa TaxID=8262 RepID=A0A9N7V347_PLEPL|nr:unnamed protein product [Pleuronectes platessa]